jgi:hypothetical protein
LAAVPYAIPFFVIFSLFFLICCVFIYIPNSTFDAAEPFGPELTAKGSPQADSELISFKPSQV